MWADKPLPDHLRVRVRVLDAKGNPLCASRELAEIDEALRLQKRTASATVARVEPEAWRRARAKWETPAQTSWKFGDVPERVLVTEQAGVPVFAFPALQAEKDGVAVRLAKTPEEARDVTGRGLAALMERQLSNDLGWLERDLRAVKNLGPLIATLAPAEELQAQKRVLLDHVTRLESVIEQQKLICELSKPNAADMAAEAWEWADAPLAFGAGAAMCVGIAFSLNEVSR